MRDSEYIAWKSETRTQIEKEHPNWTKEQVQEFLDKVESSLRKEDSLTLQKSWKIRV